MRRVPALVAMVVVLALVVIVARTPEPGTSAVFAPVRAGWMPSAPDQSTDGTRFWFCPGIAVDPANGVDGEVVVGNLTDQPMTARLSWLGTDSSSTGPEIIEVAPSTNVSVRAGERVGGGVVSAVVEIDGPGLVEQRVDHPDASPVSPCSTDTSSTWYFADGFTVADSPEQIVLSNPFDDVVIVDVSFATIDGERSFSVFQGLPIEPRSVEVIDLGVAGSGVQREELLAVTVEAMRGELVVGRTQQFLGGSRAGYTVTLGAPSPRDQWWFVDGEKGPGISERFSIFNPTDSDVAVDVIFLGITDLVEVDPIAVPAGRVVSLDVGQVAELPEGRHSVVFSTQSAPAIVVERALTRTIDGRPATTVALGATPRPDGYVASTWYALIGPEQPTPGGLVVYNVDNVDGFVELETVGPGGRVPVPGYERRPLPPASTLVVDLPGPGPYVISSTNRIFVERSLSGGRAVAWALPSEVDLR